MSKYMVDLTGRAFHVDQVGLDAISAKIGPQCRVKILRVIFYHRAQGAQLAFAPFHRTSYAGQEVSAVIGDELCEIGEARVWALRDIPGPSRCCRFRLLLRLRFQN